MYRLLFQGRTSPQEPLTVREPRLWLGRDSTCQLVLTEPGVCDRHAAIERREDGYYLTDLESATGVRVNGAPITQHRLQTGDEIELGTARLNFEILHDTAPMRRQLDWLQISTALLVAALLVGQTLLLIWIYQQPRPQTIVSKRKPAEPAAVTPKNPTTQPAPPPASTPPPTTATAPARPVILNRQIRIDRITEAVEGNRLLLTIPVRTQVGERELDPAAAAINVRFFQRNPDGTTSPWGPPLWLNVASLKNFAAKTFTASFPGSPAQYGGYIVRTYYRDQLQDAAANPAALLAAPPDTAPQP